MKPLVTVFWLLSEILCLFALENFTSEIKWVLANSLESQTEACLRHNYSPLYATDYDMNWNESTFKHVVTDILNMSISVFGNSYGIKGCCAPGLWCDSTGCFTQGYGKRFSNYGWLSNDEISVPVYTCSRNSTSTLSINSAEIGYGEVMLLGNNFIGLDNAADVYVNGEVCDDLEICNCLSCNNDGSSTCPLGHRCLTYLGYSKSYCFLSCSGVFDYSCPCDQVCTVVQGSDNNAVSLCLPTSATLYLRQCSSSASSSRLMCQASRVYQETYATSSSKLNVSLSIANVGATTVLRGDVLAGGFCDSNDDCFDGNICTIDTCIVSSGFCSYLSVEGCSSIPPVVRKQDATYMYYSYYMPSNQLLAQSQDASLVYLLNYGTTCSLTSISSTDNVLDPLEEIELPFTISFFGNLVNIAYISTYGVVALPPVRPCNYERCYLFATSSNVIAPFSADFDPIVSTTSSGNAATTTVIKRFTQSKGSGLPLFGVDSDAVHVVYSNMPRDADSTSSVVAEINDTSSDNGSTTLLDSNTFAVSIYSDGSIRFSYINISHSTIDSSSDFFGLWGAYASENTDSYLRYKLENISSSMIEDSSEMVYCPINNALGCPMEACLASPGIDADTGATLPGDTLRVHWNGTTSCSALGINTVFQFACIWAGGVAVTNATYLLPDNSNNASSSSSKNYSCILRTSFDNDSSNSNDNTGLLSCPVPAMNFSSGTVITVDIVVTPYNMNSSDTTTTILLQQYIQNYDAIPGSKSIFGAYTDSHGELSRSPLLIRYFNSSSSSNSTKSSIPSCGCNALPAYAGAQCDCMGVCGGESNAMNADCAGIPFGSALIAGCDVCSGGYTGIIPIFYCDNDSKAVDLLLDIVSQTILLLMVVCCMSFLTMSASYSIRRMLIARSLDEANPNNPNAAQDIALALARAGSNGRSRGLSAFECDAIGQIVFSKEIYRARLAKQLQQQKQNDLQQQQFKIKGNSSRSNSFISVDNVGSNNNVSAAVATTTTVSSLKTKKGLFYQALTRKDDDDDEEEEEDIIAADDGGNDKIDVENRLLAISTVPYHVIDGEASGSSNLSYLDTVRACNAIVTPATEAITNQPVTTADATNPPANSINTALSAAATAVVVVCECSICLMEIEEGNICRILPEPCGHIFHLTCIDEWFRHASVCPLCKRSMRLILHGDDDYNFNSSVSGTTTTAAAGGGAIGVRRDRGDIENNVNDDIIEAMIHSGFLGNTVSGHNNNVNTVHTTTTTISRNSFNNSNNHRRSSGDTNINRNTTSLSRLSGDNSSIGSSNILRGGGVNNNSIFRIIYTTSNTNSSSNVTTTDSNNIHDSDTNSSNNVTTADSNNIHDSVAQTAIDVNSVSSANNSVAVTLDNNTAITEVRSCL